ncbi:hypothetical protein NMY22_g19382 [Coprinellus aureogranulatus]|nr:hypothetical protein NMY22_g19382 [Coprinellus aureogranulatus]
MVLTLYGGSNATCTQRVATILHEKQVPFKFVEIDLRNREHKSPEYLEKQPFGQVPVIDDDGYLLYESRAISRYIAEKYADQGTPLIPKDLKARGRFEQAASIEQNNFDPFASKIVMEKVFKPFFGMSTDEAIYEANNETLNAKLDVYEKILSKQKYLAGDELTLADLFHLPYGTLVSAAGSDAITKRPNVARWFKEISERASWQAAKDAVKGTA